MLEKLVKAGRTLTAEDLTYQKTDQAYIETDQMYQTTYTTEVLLTDGE